MAGFVHGKSQSFDSGVDDHLALGSSVANRSLDNKPLPKTPDQDPNKGLMRSFSARAYSYASQRKNSISQQVDSSLNAIDEARSTSFESLKTDRQALLKSFRAPVHQERLTQIATQAEQLGRFTKTLLKFAGVNYGGLVLKHGLALTTAAVSIGIINAIKSSQVLALRKPDLEVRAINAQDNIYKTGVRQYEVIVPKTDHNYSIGLTASQSLKRSISHYSKSGRTNQAEQQKSAQQNELRQLVGRVQSDMQNKLFKSDEEAHNFMQHSLNKHLKVHEEKVALSAHMLALPLLLGLQLKSLKRQHQTGKLQVSGEDFLRREKNEIQYQASKIRTQLNQARLELQHLKQELLIEKDQKRHLVDNLSQQNSQIGSLENQIQDLIEKDTTAQDLIESLNSKNDELSQTNTSFLDLLRKTTGHNIALKEEVSELQDILAEAECQRDESRDQLSASESKLNNLSFYYEQQHAKLNQYEQKIHELSESLSFYQHETSNLGSLNHELEIQLQDLVQDAQATHFGILDMGDKNEKLLQENLQLKRELRMAQSNNKYLTGIALDSPLASPKSLITGQPISPRTPQQQERDTQFKHNHVRSLTASNAEKDGIIRILQQENKKLQGQLSSSQSDVQTLSDANEMLSKKLIGLDLTHQGLAVSTSHKREPSFDHNWSF